MVSDVLYLKAQGPAVISLLEEALKENRNTVVKTASGKNLCIYNVEPADKFIVLKPNPEVALKDYK